MLIHDCIPCQHGDHDGHQRIVQAAPKGMMGGQECHCEGECRNKKTQKTPTEKTLTELVQDSGLSQESIDALSFGLDSD